MFWSLLVTLGACLGLWQWERADDKRLAMAVRNAAPALVQPTEQPDQGAQVTLRGEYLTEHTLYLDNRVVSGKVGVAVLTPLRDAYGQIWLVQRGFLATGPRREPPHAATPSGMVELTGEWQEVQAGGPLYGENREGVRLQQLSLEPWHASLGSFSYPGWLHANEGDGVLIPWWEANVMPPSRHMGYAFQWWGLSLAAMVVMLIGGQRLRRDSAQQEPLGHKNK
ncbi:MULTISPECIES: SURF1 family protein [unclassified Halomonas]|uniref:SURF1 family protein n=1 Tax=unclassified Halomonas TaxID=2609666 RepID=UPI000B308726|nr:SURF1 family protein [Halomonas sp. ALS9]